MQKIFGPHLFRPSVQSYLFFSELFLNLGEEVWSWSCPRSFLLMMSFSKSSWAYLSKVCFKNCTAVKSVILTSCAVVPEMRTCVQFCVSHLKYKHFSRAKYQYGKWCIKEVRLKEKCVFTYLDKDLWRVKEIQSGDKTTKHSERLFEVRRAKPTFGCHLRPLWCLVTLLLTMGGIVYKASIKDWATTKSNRSSTSNSLRYLLLKVPTASNYQLKAAEEQIRTNSILQQPGLMV